MIKSFCNSICIILLAAFLFASLCIGGLMSNTQTAFAASSHGSGYSGDSYSFIQDDFAKDDSFNIADYPFVKDDYSIKVIQIAETDWGDLFIYTYQPGFLTHRYFAMSALMSMYVTPDDSSLYDLEFCSNYETICKYKVVGAEVRNRNVHAYNITSIYRKWISGVDEAPVAGTTVSEKSYAVGQVWRVAYSNGVPKYSVEQTNVVTILNPFVGFIEYNNGFYLNLQYHCRSHFVAFSTDYQIDDLQEADVSFVSQGVRKDLSLLVPVYTYRDPVSETVTLDRTQMGFNDPNLFGKQYRWQRIDNVHDFIQDEDLTDSTISAIENCQWVLRFTETQVFHGIGSFIDILEYTDISDVTILRLKFVSAGKTYNLGAVSNRVSGDLIPDNENTDEYASGKEVLENFKNWFDRLADLIGIPVQGLYAILIGVLVLVVFIILTSFLPNIMLPVLKGIFEVLIWIIMLPFKAIAAIIEFFAK